MNLKSSTISNRNNQLKNEDEIVEKHARLVYSIARRMYDTRYGFELDDLIQIGFIGLIRAYRAFDSNIAQFSTLATICIRRDMGRFISQNTREKFIYANEFTDRESYPITELFPDFSEFEKNIIEDKLSNKNMVDIAKERNITVEKVKKTLIKIYKKINRANDE